jgi:hypothetical protein
MVLELEIVKCPLPLALRDTQRHNSQCELRVRPSGTTRPLALEVRVLGITALSQTHFDLTLQTLEDNRVLCGTISIAGDIEGALVFQCPPSDIPLRWCGLEPTAANQLRNHDIRFVGDLKNHDERQICAKLVLPTEAGINPEVGRAALRFLRVRERLGALGFTDLFKTEPGKEPATVEELKSWLFEAL